MIIGCTDLRKSYADNEVIKGISFEIEKGHIFGLLGPSGAGKTTLIKILTGQLAYESGSVTVMGKEPFRLSGKEKKNFGIMMDSFGLYERFTCGENLAVFADMYSVPHSRVKEVLSEVGLEDAYNRPAADLSKGMRARLQLARAFMHSPKIIFLDEPTSGLDPQSMKAIHRMILDKKEEGCTVFLTTHNMEEAGRLCDKIILLNDGKIVEEGKPEEICRRYDHHKRIKMHLADGEDMEFERDEKYAERIFELLKLGMVETIHSTEPTLESVFLELTGRELEEEK